MCSPWLRMNPLIVDRISSFPPICLFSPLYSNPYFLMSLYSLLINPRLSIVLNGLELFNEEFSFNCNSPGSLDQFWLGSGFRCSSFVHCITTQHNVTQASLNHFLVFYFSWQVRLTSGIAALRLIHTYKVLASNNGPKLGFSSYLSIEVTYA